MRRRRAWIETLPIERAIRPDVVGLLRRHEIAPIVAVFPAISIGELERLLGVYGDAGLSVSLWPMLADGEGRWANAQNLDRFAALVEQIIGALGLTGALPAEVMIDLEPAIEAMRGGVAPAEGPHPAVNAHFLPLAADSRAYAGARDRLCALAEALHERGVQVAAAAPPTVLLDPDRGDRRPFQELFGTPVDGPAWDHVSVMLYTSILEGWSRGVLRRSDARAFLVWACRATAARFGSRAGASVGAVGVGAFGNEPIYRTVDELADDVALASAAGVDDLALFDLGGVLARPRPEAWLEAFTQTPPAPSLPEPTLRLRAVLAGARAAGSVLSTLGRFRRQ